MIKLDIQDYCHNCPDFEPEKVVIKTFSEVYTFVQCENKGRCLAIAGRIKEELAGKEEQICCKDCEHNTNSPDAGNANCNLFYGMTEQYGFCHKAKRRENGQS